MPDWSLRLALALGLVFATSCDGDEPPSFPALPEPTSALRPVEARGHVPEDAHIVDYWIDARLDERVHEISGTLRMVWRNSTTHTVDHLPFHLYMNAFRAADTVWMSDARGEHRGQEFARDRWGFVEVAKIERIAHDPSQPTLALEHAPADGRTPLRFVEDEDPTTMQVSLDRPLEPGASIVLELEFLTRLPEVFARTGYHGEFHMAGQWFPKIGVLEPDGVWQTHTFSLFSEFYADFGDYEVFLDVPEQYVIGATGIEVAQETTAEPGRKRMHYRAQMVHDFAWVADPKFVEHWGEHEGIRIRQLIQPEHADDAQAHLDVQIAALDSMQARFGPYPWSTITIVHAPEGAGGAGGMEYPTLYTTSDIETPPTMPQWLMRERISGLFTSVHEFGHQYFQGLFASNEYAQPWLDEGINTTSNQLVYWDEYGEDPWVAALLGHELTTKDLVSLALLSTGDRDVIDQSADRFDPLVESYGSVTYQKTAAVMLTLRELCGREPWDRAMARYSEAARFRHPKGSQLERILIEEIGGADGRLALSGDGGPGTVWLDVREYLDQGLRGAALADFLVFDVGNREPLGQAGWHQAAEGDPLPPEPSPAIAAAEQGLAAALGHAPPTGPARWILTPTPDGDQGSDGFVVVGRRSSFRVPVEVLVEFEDGESEIVMWDGQAEHHRFEFPDRKVVRAIIDPHAILLIEPRKLDNARWAEDADDRDEPLSAWLGDIGEAVNLAALGGMGI